MVLYNISNITDANNIYESFKAVGQLESFFAPALVVSVALVLFTILLPRYNYVSSLIATGFFASVLTILLRAAGLVTTDFLVIVLSFTALFIGVGVAKKLQEGGG